MRRYVLLVTVALALVSLFAFTAAPAVACDCCCCTPHTPGYWMNHPDAWPVSSLTIGGVTYTQAQAIAWMGTPASGDKSITMFRALAAAMLNDFSGCPTFWAIPRANCWMAMNGPVCSGVKASSSAWQCGGECLYWALDGWNNGY
jgi:hypothetical protein